MSDALQVGQPRGQHRLGPVQRLDLRFIVDAEHHCVVGWIVIEAADVANLLDNEGIPQSLDDFWRCVCT